MAGKSLYDYDRGRTGKPPAEGGEWKDGFCAICSVDRATHTCVKCGSTVCSEHLVSIMGLCVECAPVKNTGKTFRMSGPLNNRKEIDPKEPTIRKMAGISKARNAFVFGVEEPKDVRLVVRPPKKLSTTGTTTKDGRGDGGNSKTKQTPDEDVILFQRKKPGKDLSIGKNGEKADDDTVAIEWV